MLDRRLGKIKIKRGTKAEIFQNIFEEGEMVFSTDTKRLYIGDGKNYGGILISNKNFIIDSPNQIIPTNAVKGDIVFNKNIHQTYIVNENKNVLSLVLISDITKCQQIQDTINNLWDKINSLKTCINN
jgi:hypothetical protein